MRRFSSSWSNTLRKLGFKPSRKRRAVASRRCAIESLESRQMLTGLIYLGEDPGDCPDDCPCECSQAGTTKSGASTTSAGGLGYSSQTQSHPVLMFGLHTESYDYMTMLKAQLTVGNNAPIEVYFSGDAALAPENGGTGWSVFGIQVDASSMTSGVYDWSLDLWLSDENGVYYHPPTPYQSSNNDSLWRPLEIVNHDESQYGGGWSMLYDTRLSIQDGLPGQPDGVALVTGNNDVTWFHTPTTEGVYTRQENPTNFSNLEKDDNGTTGIETDDTYLLTDPYGTVTTFDYQGLLQTVVDRNGNALATYTYGTGSDSDKIVDIEDQAERHTYFQYDADLLVAVTDFYGTAGAQTTEYDYYSGTNLLAHMIEPDPDGTGPLKSPTTTYHYNSLGLLDSVVDPRGLETLVTYDQTRRVDSITERCGGVTDITSLQSMVTVDLATNGPDEEDWAQLLPWQSYSLTASEIEAAFAGDTYETRVVYGHETKIIRDRFGNINYMQDANGTITKYNRSSTNGLPYQVIQGDPNNPAGELITSYSFDSSGRVTSIYHPIGSQTWYYDVFGQVEYYYDTVHDTSYDIDEANGNVLSMSQWTGTEFLVTTYTYTDGTGATGIKGLVETITDPNGNVTHYTYNSQGLVETIVYAEGSDDEVTHQYVYGDRDRLSAMIDGRGARTEYLYDNLDRLIQRTDPDPNTGGITSASPEWEYRYDRVGNQTHLIDPLGNVTEYVYDTRGRLFQEILPVPTGTPSVTTKDDTQYKSVTGTWSASTQSGAYGGNIRTSSTTGASATYAFTGLDANKKYAVEVRWVPSTSPDEYDKNALWEVFAGDNTVNLVNSLRADLNSQPEGKPDGSGLMWLSLGAFTPQAGGQGGPSLTIKLSDDDNNGELVIDAVRVVEVGPVTQTEYDCSGNLVKVIDPLGHVTDYEYDELNRLITRKDPDPTTGGITANSPVTSYTYNSLGWLTSMTDPNENVTFYQYDAMGRRTKEAHVVGAGLTGEYQDEFGELLHTRVDAELNFPLSTNFAGYSDLGDGFSAEWTGAIYLDFGTETVGEATFYLNNTDYAELYIDGQFVHNNYSYGSMSETYADLELTAGWHTFTVIFDDQYDQGQSGLVVSYDIGEGKEVIPAGALATTQVTSTTYDAVGRVTALTDPNGNTTAYAYDNVDRLTSESIEIDSVPLTRDYEYDDNGNLIRKTDRNGRVTEYDYDDLDRLKTETWFDGQTLVNVIAYYYDANGNLLSADGGVGEVVYSYAYDYLNRATGANQTFGDLDPAVLFNYSYDDASRMTSTSAAIGTTDDYQNSYAYDGVGRLTHVTQAGQSGGYAVTEKDVDFAYNAAGQLTNLSRLAYGVDSISDTIYNYDKAGRLTQIAHSAINYTTYTTFEETHGYTYDKANRVTSYSNVFIGDEAEYSYDTTDQLTGVDYFGQSDESYTYDANGNRTGGSEFDPYVTGPYNRLVYSPDGDDHIYYDYDDDGNLVLRYYADNDSTVEYAYDHRNRLSDVTEYGESAGPVVKRVHYEYDAFGQMVKRVVDPDGDTGSAAIDQTFYIYDQGQVVLEFHKTGTGSATASNLSHRYLWGQAVDQLLTDEHVLDLFDAEANETLWALADNLGSVRDMVDYDGNLRLHRSFDSFGNIVEETHYDADGFEVTSGDPGYLDEAFAFTGRFFDSATGLQNNLHRWYDPSVGRWMSEDPIGFRAGDANLYRYVGNGPTNHVDASGLIYGMPWQWDWGTTGDSPPWPVLPTPTPSPMCIASGIAGGAIGAIGGVGGAIGGALGAYCCCEIEENWPDGDPEPEPDPPRPGQPWPKPEPPFNPKPYPLPPEPEPISSTDPPTIDPGDIWIGD